MISVITPTWHRHDELLNGCLPTVQAQTGVELEHIVVSDGPDPELRERIPDTVRYFELTEHSPEPHWGAPARNFGITQARGDFIAYIDDDDLWASHHLASLHDALLDDPEASWARSCGMILVPGKPPWRIGDGNLEHGRVQTSMIMHRRTLAANWVTDLAEDWLLAKDWRNAGELDARTGDATVTYKPSGGTDCAFVVLVEV